MKYTRQQIAALSLMSIDIPVILRENVARQLLNAELIEPKAGSPHSEQPNNRFATYQITPNGRAVFAEIEKANQTY